MLSHCQQLSNFLLYPDPELSNILKSCSQPSLLFETSKEFKDVTQSKLLLIIIKLNMPILNNTFCVSLGNSGKNQPTSQPWNQVRGPELERADG